MDRRDEASSSDYEQLRRHVQRKAPEHPAGRQLPRAPAREVDDTALPLGSAASPRRAGLVGDDSTSRVSVMDWLVGVGQAVARKLRRAQGSAMARVHPRK